MDELIHHVMMTGGMPTRATSWLNLGEEALGTEISKRQMETCKVHSGVFLEEVWSKICIRPNYKPPSVLGVSRCLIMGIKMFTALLPPPFWKPLGRRSWMEQRLLCNVRGG